MFGHKLSFLSNPYSARLSSAVNNIIKTEGSMTIYSADTPQVTAKE
jgi:hypothetical protein